jgi:hypothetical protein
MLAARKETCQSLLTAESFDARASKARVVEWQTRTFEGRMPKGMRVQVPPRAPNRALSLFVRQLTAQPGPARFRIALVSRRDH